MSALGSRARARERGCLFASAQERALVRVSARGRLAHGRQREREAACSRPRQRERSLGSRARARERGRLFASAREAAWLMGASARERLCLFASASAREAAWLTGASARERLCLFASSAREVAWLTGASARERPLVCVSARDRLAHGRKREREAARVGAREGTCSRQHKRLLGSRAASARERPRARERERALDWWSQGLMFDVVGRAVHLDSIVGESGRAQIMCVCMLIESGVRAT